ncbi:MAG: haloacid dehalogenase-like hydrolase [Nitrospinae bacterium]|nr:haloacid dehalogenase-like hydrolase [Nitrospinota bacterium]
MRIGFDFDNTIVSYDELFYNVAIEKSLIPPDLSKSKLAVRDYLRKANKESTWTELQGYVYGKRMKEAVAFKGAVEFIKLARSNGTAMVIVSHKTKHPFMGPKFDLHEAARGWVESFLVDGVENLIDPGQVFFELTKEEKLSRIDQCDCDFFIDDLPEILLMSEFPKKTRRILFDPENCHDVEGVEIKVDSWQGIRTFFEKRWKTGN